MIETTNPVARREQEPMAEHVAINPECRDGKHRGCDGQGWNLDTDNDYAPCPCACHREESAP